MNRLGAVCAAVVMLAGSAAWARPALTVELEKDSCAGPVAAVAAGAGGLVVFHHMDAGRYVISLPAEAGGLRLTVAEGGRWIPGRLSAVSNGRRYAIGEDGERIVVAVGGDGEVHIQLDGL
jgi:hypothetical protein